MAIRILTGVLMTDADAGEATVTFDPHAVEGDARGIALAEIGPSLGFGEVPARFIALREIAVDAHGRARIDDKQVSEEMVRIAWSGAKEISYLVIGEVAD